MPESNGVTLFGRALAVGAGLWGAWKTWRKKKRIRVVRLEVAHMSADDIAIGKRAAGTQTTFAVTLADQTMLAADPTRIGLSIAPVQTNNVIVSFGSAATATNGYQITPAMGTVNFSLAQMGSALQAAVHVLGVTAGQTITLTTLTTPIGGY